MGNAPRDVRTPEGALLGLDVGPVDPTPTASEDYAGAQILLVHDRQPQTQGWTALFAVVEMQFAGKKLPRCAARRDDRMHLRRRR